MLSEVNYERIGQDRHAEGSSLGLFITFGDKPENGTVLSVDNILLWSSQEPLRTAGVKAHLTDGADEAAELDAKRAIGEGTRLAAMIQPNHHF
jgi:2,4-dienoyl-CoA reductase (NADPH2)